MSEFVTWTAKKFSRRKFVQRAAAASFGIFSGLAIGVPKAFAYPCCTGPNGTGNCGSGFCNGHACHSNDPGVSCVNITGYCPSGSPCWTTDICVSGTCCDCQCCESGTCWYCYCYG